MYIGPKVIVPYGVEYERRYPALFPWSLRHYKTAEFNDIDKALCFISGRRFDSIVSISVAIDHHLHRIRDGHDYNTM